MELNFKGYTFIYENDSKDLEKFIGDYSELISTIRLVFKISENDVFNISYVDVDGHFDILNQNEYNQVLSYHMSKLDDPIKITIKKRLRVDPSSISLQQSNPIISNNEKQMSNSDLNEINRNIFISKVEIVETLSQLFNTSLKEMEKNIKKTIIKPKITSHVIAQRVNSISISSTKCDNSLMFANENNHIRNCSICNSDIKPKYTCTICPNFNVCMYCENEHPNHPLLTLNNLEYFGKTNFIFNHYKTSSPVKMTLMLKSEISEICTDQVAKLEFLIINKSHLLLSENELMLTAINNIGFNIENRIIKKILVPTEGNSIETIEIKSPSKSGLYVFDIILLHNSLKLCFQPIRIKIKVIDKRVSRSMMNMSTHFDIDSFFYGFPGLSTKLSYNQKIQLVNLINDKLTNLSLYNISEIFENNMYDFDKSLNQILNIT
jgi:hypothetical protein